MQAKRAAVALFIFLTPVPLFALGSLNNPSRNTQQDSIASESCAEQTNSAPVSESSSFRPNNNNPKQNAEQYDYRKDGLFIGLFHVGMNFSQIDGDAYWGYNKIGFDGGVGTMVRVSRHFAPSIELNYTMWGAQAAFFEHSGNLYKTNLNYVQIPVAINILDKEIIMFSAGLNLGFVAAYKERNEVGQIVTDSLQAPRQFDLDGFLALHVIIKKQFAIGLKFSYSFIPIRPVEPQYAGLSHIQNEYNNVVTLRFMYILKATTFKKKR